MRRAERRQQLLKIACQLVAQHGGDALTMTALSELAGVAKPVVYTHFSNSGDVIIALLDQHYEQLTKAVIAQVKQAKTLEEYVSRLVDASFDFENVSDLPIRKITNGFSADDRVNQAYLRHEEEFVSHWEQLLRASGAGDKETGVAAYGISSLMSNTVYTYALRPKQRLARDTLKTMLLAVIEAVAPGARSLAQPQLMPLNVQNPDVASDESVA